MPAAWPWIKWGAFAALIVTIWLLWLTLDASQLEQTMLNEQLSQARADNQTNLTAIELLKGDAEQANQLLVQRKRDQKQAEEKLNADMATLKAKLAGIECHIPSDVTDRLREPY
jgi:hypothetical protein